MEHVNFCFSSIDAGEVNFAEQVFFIIAYTTVIIKFKVEFLAEY